MLSSVNLWFTDPILADTWLLKLSVCFSRIRLFYTTFGLLTKVGDRLADKDTGLMIPKRSIDNGRKHLILTLCQ